jgi:gamma-glutamyltranspeptidase / glutathione hydrolase
MSTRVKALKRLRSVLSTLLATLLILALLAPSILAQTPQRTPGVPADPGIPVWARGIPQHGLVAVAHPNAARVGAEILGRGGNAIDAAAAIQFALNVEEPMGSGIGGGNFTMIYLADAQRVVVIDGRERAPLTATPDMFLGPDGAPMPFAAARTSGLSVGVPGTLAGTAAALGLYGTMSLSDVLQPAIRLAEEGFVVSEWFAEQIAGTQAVLGASPGRAYSFFRADGSLIGAGDLLVQRDLANTFRMIAEQGVDAFYRGPIADAISTVVKERGGRIEPYDIATYAPIMREPTMGSYRGWDIASMPPPSSGGLTLVMMLNLLERFNIGEMGHNTPDTLHVMIEAMRVAYADRNRYMGDADFIDIPARGLLDPTYLAQRSAMINVAQSIPEVTAGDPWAFQGGVRPLSTEVVPARETGETTHFVVADRWGNVVSMTTTIEAFWGSGIMVPGYGFLLNNEITDFDFTPGGANQVFPLKRPRSSMTPTMLLKDGRPWMATGSPGGAAIITTVMQVIMNVIDHGMTIQEAVDAPRIHHTSPSRTAVTRWDVGIPIPVLAAVEARGHDFADQPAVVGSAQTLVIDMQTGRIYGAGDPRRQGTVISVPMANDGRTLWMQPPHVVASFQALWGDLAAYRWAYEHNLTLAR